MNKKKSKKKRSKILSLRITINVPGDYLMFVNQQTGLLRSIWRMR